MRKILISIFVIVGGVVYSQNIAECCVVDLVARCTGSMNCRACTNCSRCGHCNKGGSCGVCYKNNKVNVYEPKTQSYHTIYSLKDDVYSQKYKDILIVTSDNLNLRYASSTNSEILEKLLKNQEVMCLAYADGWYKVKVIKTGTVGFVYSKYVAFKH